VLSAPGVSAWRLFTARALLPVIVTAFLFLVMVVQVDLLFGLHTKGEMATTVLAIIPALLVASFLGVAASALVSSQTQAVMASALYFAALMLLTGFITPLSGASPVVVALSRLLPLTFAMPALNAWFYGAGSHFIGGGWLALQLAASLILGWLSFRRFLRRL
jgi:ABC-type multidrug transport system permease subunit